MNRFEPVVFFEELECPRFELDGFEPPRQACCPLVGNVVRPSSPCYLTDIAVEFTCGEHSVAAG